MWNLMKLAGISFRFFWPKNETSWCFHDFMRHKIMKPPGSVGKKNKTDGTRLAAWPRAVSFIFFPDRIWRFHNFMHLKSWNHQPVSFLSQKNVKPIPDSFIQFHVITDEKIKKNKGGLSWNLIFYIKQGNKSRVGTFFQNMLVLLKWTKPTYVKGWETTLDERYLLHI